MQKNRVTDVFFFPRLCKTKQPSWLSGSFILPTVGQFEVGAMSFQVRELHFASLPPFLVFFYLDSLTSDFSLEFYYGLQGILDGFGKLNRFDIRQGQVCFTARMMDTGFYNDSIALQKVAPAVLFEQTAPPSQFR
jgi:hypothetical protein